MIRTRKAVNSAAYIRAAMTAKSGDQSDELNPERRASALWPTLGQDKNNVNFQKVAKWSE
jgi:hypothetical protein